MPRPIFTSLSPNTLPSDIAVTFATLIRPWHWRTFTSLIPQLGEHIERVTQTTNVQLTSSGRSALYEALRAADVGPGDEVLLQAFTCLAVPEAIVWTGARPVYIDIDPSTYNIDPGKLEASITPRTKALIIQHTFGIPAPLDALIPIARAHNLLVIEDLAHGLGGSYNGRALGSFGDLTITSFGRDKTISSVFGGALLSPRSELAEHYKTNIGHYLRPSALWVVQQLLHPLLVNLFLPFYFVAHIGKLLLVLSQRLGLLSMAVTTEEKTSGAKPHFIDRQFHPALLPLLHNQLNQLETFTKRRRVIAQRYLKALDASPYLHSIATEANWLRFPLHVADKTAVLEAAKKQRLLLGDWYHTPVTPATLEQRELTHYVPGSCPAAEAAALQTINLPTHPRLSDEDIERIISFIKTL